MTTEGQELEDLECQREALYEQIRLLSGQISARRAAARAGRGAALLDQKIPGWASRISTSSLNLSAMTNCILGQLHGTYRAGMNAIFGDPCTGTARRLDAFDAIDHGFAPSGLSDEPPLREAWIAEISRRA